MMGLGLAYYGMQDETKAIKILEDALEMKGSKKATIQYILAEWFEKRKEYEKAASLFLKTIDSDVQQYSLYFKLGTVYFELQKHDEAVKYFEKALEVKDDLTEPYRDMLRKSLSKYQDLDDKIHIQNIEEQLARKITVADLKAYDLEIFKIIQRNDRMLVMIYNHLGTIFSNKGDKTRALANFQKSLEINPKDEYAAQNYKQLKSQN